MSWKDRILAPIAGVFGGALIAVVIWYYFFEVHVSTGGSLIHQAWESIVVHAEVTAVVASVGAALGLLVGIFVAIFGRES
jgi:hypothetical protein